MILPDFDMAPLEIAIDDELKWLSLLGKVGWSAHHALIERCCVKQNDVTTILPLIREKVDTLEIQFHCMKIISKTIASKLKQVLPSLISFEQTAYVNKSTINEGARLISDILEMCNLQGIGQSFKNFLIILLQKYGFGA